MSNYSVLKQDINNNIYENQTQQITGTVLNAILNEMTASLGAGYQFAGVATLGMNPGDPDQRVFYLAGEGIYTNFGGLQVPQGKLGVLKWDFRWTLQTIDGLGGGGANLTGYVSLASTDDLPEEGQPTLGYLCGTNLYLYVGTGGDTKEGKYQNCGSFRGPQGLQGDPGVGIATVTQTTTSTEDEGINVITVTKEDGTQSTFQVRNGSKGSQGIQGPQGVQGEPGRLQAQYKEVETLPTASADTVDYIYLVASQTPNTYDMYYTEENQGAYSWKSLGTTAVQLSDYATKAEVNQLEAEVTDLGQSVNGGTIIINPVWGIVGKYIDTSGGLVLSANWSISSPILLKKGQTITVGTQGSNVCVIAATTDGTTYTPLTNIPQNTTGWHEYTYTATEDITIAYSGKTSYNDVTVSTSMVSIRNEIAGVASVAQQIGNNLTKEINERKASSVPQDLGKNKCVPAFIVTGKYFTQDGTMDNASYNAYYYIPVESNTKYTISGFIGTTDYPVGSSVNYIQFIDKDFNVIGYVGANTRTFTTQVGTKYVNVSVGATIVKVQLELGEVASPVYEDVRFGNTNYQDLLSRINAGIPDYSIGIKKLDFISTKNLIDLNDADFASGKIISTNTGTLDTNSSYNTTGFCRVLSGHKYTFSNGDTGGTASARFVLFYDSEKSAITTSYASNASSPITAPLGASFVRITYLASVVKPQLEEGEIVTPYMPFTLQIVQNAVSLSPRFAGVSGSFRTSGSVAASGVLTLPKVHIQKNVLLSTRIIGTISLVKIGVGYRSPNMDYNSRWLEIDATSIKVYGQFNDSPLLYHDFTHGLTLDGVAFVSVESTLTKTGMATRFSLTNGAGDRYVADSSKEWGCGTPFVLNSGLSSLDVELSFFPRDINKKVWLYGDSYLNFLSDARWGYYCTQDGNLDFLANNKAGQTPEEAYSDLLALLTIGCPNYLVWLLGMNGDGVETQVDGHYIINDYQKLYIDSVVAICRNNGIIPVFGCIPTVPNYQKTGLCTYIKSLGYRYIDIAEAVGTDENGDWREGLLSSDDVHPTAAGARVIYGQVLRDLPEITQL